MFYPFLLFIGGTLSLTSCATLFSKKQTVTIDSNVKGAHVWKGHKYMGTTPLKFKTKAAKSTFTLSKDGYLTTTVNASTGIRWNTLWNWFNGFYPGWLIDLTVGSTQKYTKTNYYVTLKEPTKYPEPTVVTTNKVQKQQPREMHMTNNTQNKIPISNDPKIYTPKELYNKYQSAVFIIFTSDGSSIAQGSGFFVSSNGIAISNYHVFKGTYKGLEMIQLTNGEKYNITEVLGYSEVFDYIVFKVNNEGKQFNYIPITKKGYDIGDKVIAIGSPKGLVNTLSDGLISQKRDNWYIQISVPIDHGSSGGALINEHGEVIGITSGGRDDSGANLNFARDIRSLFIDNTSNY